MPKKAVLPNKIIIHDELGQQWSISEQDDLWDDAIALTDSGKHDAILPISTILSKRGWGWWSCFKTQDEWIEGIGIPMPDHNTLDNAARCSAGELTPLLQEFGAYVAFLEAQVGLLLGRRNALKNAYDSAMMVAIAQLDGKGSIKSKESEVLALNETLRQTKRMFIDTDMLYETAKGMCGGYVKAYEATSRIVTVRLAEMEISGSRRSV